MRKISLKSVSLVNSKPTVIAILMSLTFLLYLLSGCMFIPKEEEVLAPPLKDPPKIEYELLDLKKRTIEKKIQCTGYFVSILQKDLSFNNRSGRLKAIQVKAGDKVKAGQLLAELQTDNLELQIKQQEIALNKLYLANELTKLNREKDIELSSMRIERLKKQLENMNSVSDTYSNEQLQGKKDELSEAEILYKNAKSVYDTNLKTAENDIEASRLQLDSLKKELKNAQIISPIEGTIDFRTDSNIGDFVEAYKTIVRVADPGNLQISYSEDKVDKFETGMKVSMKIDDNDYEGTVVMTPSNAPLDADEKTKKSIRIRADKLPEGVDIGDSVIFTLVLERRENVIVIPSNLIHTLGERKYVHVLENGVKRERDIETGIEAQIDTEVLEGLSEEDKLIRD